ncbi:hypothetical protein RKLH11_834 [Rhodobacteraceae bacterium KLH11]|nr:hypothetical protein RKLH11_834 [Rhodobacteraceae bacterium KLH11]
MPVLREFFRPSRGIIERNRLEVPDVNADIHRVSGATPVVMDMTKEL